LFNLLRKNLRGISAAHGEIGIEEIFTGCEGILVQQNSKPISPAGEYSILFETVVAETLGERITQGYISTIDSCGHTSIVAMGINSRPPDTKQEANSGGYLLATAG
jgi:hypothetical protein